MDRVTNIAWKTTSGESYYPLTDIQGTVWGYVDSQNNVVASWLSKDPIRLLGGINLYAFCGNSPILYVDPYGDDFYSVIDTVSDFCAGFGDTILFGVTKK